MADFRRLLQQGTCFWIVLLIVVLSPMFTPAKLFAAPFSEYVEFTQPDNTKITLWGEGDEFHADFETTTGYTVVFDPQQKAYYYARRSPDGKSLLSTGVLAHHDVPHGLARHIRMDRDAIAAAARAKRKKWDLDTGLSERWKRLKSMTLGGQSDSGAANVSGATDATQPEFAPPSSTTIGTKVGLTLLIDFADDPATIPQTDFDSFLNGDNYTGYGNNGSVKKYFSDVSGGNLTYTNVVTMYVRMTQPKSYYNNTSIDSGTQGRLLINDALAILKARPDYNSTILPTFNALTTDGSNRVVAFNVFYAGGNGGVWSYGLWPHSWSLASTVALGNGKSVYKYQITNVGTSLALGTFSHENGHMLCGFPDLYDYDYDSKGGAGAFSLMGSGASLNSGRNPSQVDAYLKLAAGWATVIDITSSSNLTGTLVAAPDNGYNTFYRFRKPGVPTEYFLLENRQKTGRDSYLPAAGIAVWHVDQFGDRDNQSLIPNSNHENYELTLVQADNLWHFESNTNGGDSKDLYYFGNSAAAYTNRLDDASSPNGHWWDGTTSSINLNSISTSAMSMTFNAGNPGGPISGVCGSSDNGAFSIAPASNLCSVGSGSAVTGIGPWFWSCNGLNGGATANCIAYSTSQQVAITSFPQDFESVTPPALPAGWSSVVSSGSGGSWRTNAGTVHPSGIAAHSPSKLVYFNSWTATTGAAAYLASPVFSLAGKVGGKVSLWVYHDTEYSTAADRVDVYVNTTNNLTGATLLGSVSRYTGSTGWYQYVFNIPSSYNGATNYLLINGVSAYGNDIHLDDINVYAFTSLYPLTFSFAGSGYGSVNSAPSGVSCTGTSGSACSVINFDGGASVVLSASSDSSSTYNSAFTGWTTNTTACPGTGTCSVTLNSPVNVTATFNRDRLVKNSETGVSYGSIHDAIGAASFKQTIQVRDNSGLTPFADALTIDEEITLKGGFDAVFGANDGYTTTKGGLTVILRDDHVVRVQRINVQQ